MPTNLLALLDGLYCHFAAIVTARPATNTICYFSTAELASCGKGHRSFYFSTLSRSDVYHLPSSAGRSRRSHYCESYHSYVRLSAFCYLAYCGTNGAIENDRSVVKIDRHPEYHPFTDVWHNSATWTACHLSSFASITAFSSANWLSFYFSSATFLIR